MSTPSSPSGGAGDQAQERADRAADQARETTDQTAGQAHEATDQAADTAHRVAEQAQDRAHQLIETAQQKAQAAVGQARDKTQQWIGQSSGTGGQVGERAQQGAAQVQSAATSEWGALLDDYENGRYGAVARRFASWVGALVLVRGVLRTVTGRGRARRAQARLGEDLLDLLETAPRSRINKEAAKIAERDS